ncbi:MAG: HEAT repeat domain-containing protein, partial [Myxococcales bacterium]|nr:HEAT repeat domain-containing protein [Myxococcales bacterium]
TGSQRYVRSAGLLQELHYAESLRVSGAGGDLFTAEVALDVSARSEAGRVSAWPREGLVGAAQVASSAAGQALEGRAQGLTFEQLLTDITTHRDSGRLPEHERWLWRASGRLLREPERSPALAQACVDGTLTGPGRALAVDLLANVGHGPAQAALREVLAHAAVTQSADYPTLLQHAVLLETPNAATLAFFDERARTLTGTARRAALVTLGALLDRARQQGSPPSAEQLTTLRRALADATTPLDQRAALVALSNARASGAEEQVRALVSSEDTELRAAALRALGSLGGSAQARELLLAHATEDTHGGARVEALDSLRRLGPSADELHQLAVASRAGRFARADLGVLANFARRCAADGAPHEPLMELVEALLATPDLPRDVGHTLTALRAAEPN